jgi:uncharacterized protein YndB with AHSA1/START domain
MTIAPIRRTIEVAVPPERAFTLFATRMHDWWPMGHSISDDPRVGIEMESHVGGWWGQIGERGTRTQWGKVLAWEPPGRLLLAWQINAEWCYDPGLVTELELTFAPVGSNTLVTLEHRDLERFGESAEKIAEQLRNGWPGVVQQFADFANGKIACAQPCSSG